MGRIAFAAVLGLSLAALPAHAAPPWSAPETVSSPGFAIFGARVVFGANGRGLATWTWNGPIPDPKTGYPSKPLLAVREPGAMEFEPEQSSPTLATEPLVYGSRGVLALERRSLEGGESALYVRFGDTSGIFTRRQELSSFYDHPGDASVAVHRGAVAAWTEAASRARQVVRAAVWRPGRDFGPAVTLTRHGRAEDVVAGAGPGVVFVAWERDDIVEARVKRRGRWGPVQQVGLARPWPTTFEVTFSGRRAYLAWLADDGESGALRVAVLPGGRSLFRRAQTVDRIGHRVPLAQGIALAALPAHGAMLAWTDWDGQRSRARAAVTGPGARFGRQIDVSPPGEPATLGDVESTPDGAVLAIWTRLDAAGKTGDRVRAALRGPGGSFGIPEDVSDLDRAQLHPDVAFDRDSRRWAAVWAQTIGPEGRPEPEITRYVRSSTRPG